MRERHHGWHFTEEKIGQRLGLIASKVHRKSVPLDPFRLMELPDVTLDPPICHDPSGWEEVPHQSYWGHACMHFVMKSGFQVPAGWDPDRIALHLPLGVLGDIFNHPEAIVYIDQNLVGSADRYHHTLPLKAKLADGGRHVLSLHGWTGHAGWPPDPTSRAKLFMGTPELVERDPDTLTFVALARAGLDAVSVLAKDSAERRGLLDALDRAFSILDTRDPIGEAFYHSVPTALSALRQGIAAAGQPMDVTLHGIGHAHMDIAYLWPIGQMRLKNARTYSNVLRLMEDDPEFRFSHSQPALYEMTEQDFPEVFEGIKSRVSEGRWEVMGGMWVEPDLNVPSGEALVRQLVLGRRYFEDRFGAVETPVLWLPDTFGFPGQIPQLMRGAGLKWFVTNKLNWNQINRVPWSTHHWEGIDGSRVLAHVLTTPRDVQYLPFPTNYKSDLTAKEVMGTWTHAGERPLHDLPICYGYGDGGGGPTEGLLARAHAYQDMPGMPRFKFSSVRDTFERIEETAHALPVWRGEHYLEGHRGVYTSQGWIKRANRKAETALHEAEALAVMAGLAPDLTEAWKLVCLNQFHDIVTGTSVTEVYEDARRDYDRIFEMAADATESAVRVLAGDTPAVLSTLPTSGPRLVETDVDLGRAGQETSQGWLYLLPEVPAYSVTPLEQADAPLRPVRLLRERDDYIFENAYLTARMTSRGHILSVLDKRTGREIIPDGAVANELQVFEDRPICWDAWDIDPHFEDRREAIDGPCDVQVLEDGPLRVSVRVVFRWRNSRISQVISLGAHMPRIDIQIDADWHETHTLLKTAFPVTITAPKARFDIQWGTIERSTSRETSFDAARFEVPAQKWASLSEDNLTVALMNDCKYGYDVRDHVLRLTLIKSPTSPDPVSDQGAHCFTYALYVGASDEPSALDHAAYDLNNPARVAIDEKTEGRTPWHAACDTPDVLIETIKPADDGDGIVLRLFETRGLDATTRLSFSQPISQVTQTSLLEEPLNDISVEGQGVELEFGAFEIVTLRIR